MSGTVMRKGAVMRGSDEGLFMGTMIRVVTSIEMRGSVEHGSEGTVMRAGW